MCHARLVPGLHVAIVFPQSGGAERQALGDRISEQMSILGADLYLRDKEGKTALEEAKRFNRPDKAAVLEAAQAHRH